jgi:beta-glucosidase
MKSKTLSAGKIPALSLIAMILSIIACKQTAEFVQPELGAKSVNILNLDGKQFKDLNKNGELDKYEDWRLPADERSLDLLSKMSVDEKAGFMLINSLNMVGTRAAEISGGKISASDLSESEQRVWEKAAASE